MSDAETDNSQEEARDEDTIKILLATDCHLGYEHSTKRLQENDSFITFKEILEHAVEQEVDFVLLGGDLFHHSKPSQKVVLQCLQLLKEHVLGSRDIKIEFLSNPDFIFPATSQKIINYEDPNINVGLPIFSIHGNHDNPSFESTGSMDLLGASGLVNYFGKWANVSEISVPPLIFHKGKSYVCLYGLSYMNDQRLSRLLRDKKIHFLRPTSIPESFNIFVLHQNRAKHTANGFIPENKLPAFLDLVFWGHEHECRVIPEQIVDDTVEPPGSYYVTQPGSSVATSLCEGESKEKHIGLLKVNKDLFHIQPIKLKTVRPFVFDTIHVRDIDVKMDCTKPNSDAICEFIDEHIENVLLPRAKLQITGHPKQPTTPLIRLRIIYTDEKELFDTMSLSRKYSETIANARDLILFRKDKCDKSKKNMFDVLDEDDINDFFQYGEHSVWNLTVPGAIKNYFNSEDNESHLKVLSVDGMNEALKRYVEVGDDEAFQDVIKHQLKKNEQYIENQDVDEEEEMIEKLKVYREERSAAEATGEERRDILKLLDDETRKARRRLTQATAREDSPVNSESGEEQEANEDSSESEKQSTKAGGGKASRGRGKTTGKATAARGKKSTTRGRGRGRGSKAALDVSVSPKRSKEKKNLSEDSENSSRGNKDASTSSSSRILAATKSSNKNNVAHMYNSDSESD